MNKFTHFSILLATTLLSSCGVYTFTGTTITAETISIQNFYNDADGGPPDLAQDFTQKLRDYYQQNTSLTLIPENGELLVEGSITGYRLTPVAPAASGSNDTGDLASLTRLTITISASYVNADDPEFDFSNRQFSFFADFDSGLDLTSVEDGLIEEIFDQIILDIFNASVANW